MFKKEDKIDLKELLEFKLKQLENKKKIDKEFLEFLEKSISIPAERIMEAMRRGITKYILKPSNRTVWIAMGEHQPYLIYPDSYCSCFDFFIRIFQQNDIVLCKHLVAQKICERLNNYDTCELNDEDFNRLLEDIDLKSD